MELILLLIAGVALINIAASAVILRVSAFSTSQRLLQLMVIWFVPILGAIVCAAFASSPRATKSISCTSWRCCVAARSNSLKPIPLHSGHGCHMKIAAPALLAVLLSGCTGGFTEATPLTLVQSGDSWDGRFIRTCGYVVATRKSCSLKVCAAGTPARAMTSCAPVSMVHLSSTSCLTAPLPREGWAKVGGYFLALEPDDKPTDRNRFVIRKALVEAVANQCIERGA